MSIESLVSSGVGLCLQEIPKDTTRLHQYKESLIGGGTRESLRNSLSSYHSLSQTNHGKDK